MNLGGRSFQELVDEGVIDEYAFPYSTARLKAFKQMFKAAAANIVFYTITVLFTVIGGAVAAGLKGKNLDAPSLESVIGKDAALTVSNGWSTLMFTVKTCMLLYFIIALVVYIICTVRSWAFHERNCLKSDIKALRVSRKVISRLSIKRRITALTSSKRDGERLDYDKQAQLDALTAMKTMFLQVHTRQSLDEPLLECSYTCTIDIPEEETASEHLMKYVKPLPAVLTKILKGSVTFSDMMMSRDGTQLVSTAVEPVDTSEDTVQDTTETEHYESVFPYDLFVDTSAAVKEKKLAAAKWSSKVAAILDKVLVSGGQRTKRLNVITTAASATFDYEIPFSLELQDLDKWARLLDQSFKTKGTTVELHDGDLRIVMALPDKLRVGIDNRTLFEDAFGVTMDRDLSKV